MTVGRVAGYAAFGAALIYVLLKVAWIAGSSFGITDMSGLSRTDWVANNLSTAGLGIVGAVVALATVRPWGKRIPLWLIAVPMWVGAGLLAPFIILMPAAAIFEAAGWWSPPATAPDGSEPTLAPWTFAIVYGSFIVLGAGLTIAFPAYAWSRLRTAVRGTVGQIPPGATHPAQVPLAWTAAVLAIGLAVVRLSWAAGVTAGLRPGERDIWLRLGDIVTAAQVSCAAVGILVLVHRWGKDRPFALPLIATWLGAGGMVGTGFLSMPTILAGDRWAPTGQTFTSHATSTFLTCLAGAAISTVTLFLLVERAAAIHQRLVGAH
ncbi:hypothetical protein GCM10022251_31260 [Phytohabitans flavus]|uniref:Uncharacterized protein n=1 Tax=Phytohabitans flavus TaxID=1076124 RepID=A0A6F8XWV4_9ACTN|nr:hypothetical protein [Phytohabitans flavus]BCB78279.1 hypothetical protein Pflav_046890 [Phytohabitans flavus]